jgi:type IV secretion system protein VirB5
MRVTRTVIAFVGLMVAGSSYGQLTVQDPVNLANAIASHAQDMAQWATSFSYMEQQIQQAQQQIKALTGSRGMGALYASGSLNATSILPANWQNVLATVKSTAAYQTERAKYPTVTDRPKANALYDTMASQDATMDDLYQQSDQRIDEVQSLMQQIDDAEDPAAKEDLSNRLISEQNALQANQNLASLVQARQKQELDQAYQQAQEEYACKEFNRSGC